MTLIQSIVVFKNMFPLSQQYFQAEHIFENRYKQNENQDTDRNSK